MSRTSMKGFVYRQYTSDGLFVADYKSSREASEKVALKALDYKVIHFCMRRGWVRLAYELCGLRAALVRRRQKSREQE